MCGDDDGYSDHGSKINVFLSTSATVYKLYYSDHQHIHFRSGQNDPDAKQLFGTINRSTLSFRPSSDRHAYYIQYDEVVPHETSFDSKVNVVYCPYYRRSYDSNYSYFQRHSNILYENCKVILSPIGRNVPHIDTNHPRTKPTNPRIGNGSRHVIVSIN